MFSTCLENFQPCLSNLKLSSANSFSLDQSEILLFEKRLKRISKLGVISYQQILSISTNSRLCRVLKDYRLILTVNPLPDNKQKWTKRQTDGQGKNMPIHSYGGIKNSGKNINDGYLTLSQTSPGFYMSAVQVF